MTDEPKFPETIPAAMAQYATLCPDRSPEFKVHSKKGLAHNAIGGKKPHTEIAMYELQEGAWRKIWEYTLPKICRCGRQFSDTSGSYGRNRYNLDPNHEGTVKDAPVVCFECWKEVTVKRRAAQTEAQERKRLAELQAKYSQPATYGRIGGLENLTAKD